MRSPSASSHPPPLMDPPLPFLPKRHPPSDAPAAPSPLAVIPAGPSRPPPPSSSSSAFYKTRLCQKFCATGSCHYGDSCTFAHGAEDVRAPPPHWHDAASAIAPAGRPPPAPRGRICRKFFAGEACPYGDGCSYLHVRRDGSPATPHEVNAGALGRPSRSSEERGSSHQSALPWSRDTKRCRDWENAGRRGNEERFGSSRGSAELKQPPEFSEGNMEKTGSVARGTPSTSTNELIPGKKGSVSLQKTPKSFWHLDGIKKLNGIYADWID